MKKIEQVPLFDQELEMDNPDALKKTKRKMNCLQERLLELMDEHKVSLSEIQKATDIPWSTLMGWHDGDVKAQMLERNIWALAKFFGLPLENLAFGIGPDGESDLEEIKNSIN